MPGWLVASMIGLETSCVPVWSAPRCCLRCLPTISAVSAEAGVGVWRARGDLRSVEAAGSETRAERGERGARARTRAERETRPRAESRRSPFSVAQVQAGEAHVRL